MFSRTVLESCAAIYLFAVLADVIRRRRWLKSCLELGAFVVVVVIALLINNSVSGVVSLGEGQPPLVAVLVMFGAIIVGIGARYFFYLLPGQFSWLSLLKPATISPIVLIPLIGSIQTLSSLTAMQLVSFGLLAFQNGFFWQAVLDSARPISHASGGNREP
jgi:hypothetical protein